MRHNLICIIGPDGTGKSTQAIRLHETLRKAGINSEYKWLRFNHFFSLPILTIAHILGLSEMVTLNDGKKIGYHHFERSKLVSSVYPLTMFLDTLLNYALKVYFPIKLLHKTIVCDRFIYDTIVDVMISTGRSDLNNEAFLKLFSSIIPKSCIGIRLTADEGLLRQRRNDVMQDLKLKEKIELYEKLESKFDLLKIDATLPITEINKIIEKAIFQ